MNLDPTTLARAQFAMTIMFHYLFPPLSIGLGALMVIMEASFMRTGDVLYEDMTRFWSKIFAVNFAMGVSSGIVMEFQFGTNWAGYSRFVGDVFGSALAAEGIFAFFLESGFLAILVFGWDRVSARMHFLSTVMVFVGSVFSAIWIVVANSWQQTPSGYHLVEHNGVMRAEITDYWAMVFNPSSVPRVLHVLLGSFVLGAFFVMSVSAFYLLRGKHLAFAKRALAIALVFGAVSSLAEAGAGHLSADTVARYQPAKLAAFEGHFETGTGPAPMYLFGVPDVAARTVRHGVSVPALLSLLVHFDAHTPVQGLDATPREDWPPVVVPFFSYHLMITLGMGFIGVTLLGLALLKRGTLFETRWFLKLLVVAVVGPYMANEAGWVSAEVGRQPWIVYGLLRTVHGVSRSVPAAQIMVSIIGFAVVYAGLFAVWVYVLHSKIMHGPELSSEASTAAPAETNRETLLDVAASRPDGTNSMTMAHSGPGGDGSKR